jgi:DUF1680 family protein
VVAPEKGWEDRLYRARRDRAKGGRIGAVQLVAVPYYAWANREPGAMQVWLQSLGGEPEASRDGVR